MLRTSIVFLYLCLSTGVYAQQTLSPRVAVYGAEGERFVVDSVGLFDSVLVMYIGNLNFEIAEERFARIEPIPGATFSAPDQVYSFSLRDGSLIVGQVVSYKRGVLEIKAADGTTQLISRDELQALHLEKRNVFERSHVKSCATANFISSPYALKPKEVVFSSFIYGMSAEVGVGHGFSVKGLSAVVPFLLPTGYEFLYKRRFESSRFSVGISAGQVWIGPIIDILESEVVNSSRNFINILTPSFTYHMGESYLKTSVTVLSGSTRLSENGGVYFTSTYSMPGFTQHQNRWNFTLNYSPNNRVMNDINTLLLVGFQKHAPKASYTIGLGLTRGGADISIIPFPYAYFSLYGSKEQRKINSAFNIQKRMRLLRRSVDYSNALERSLRKRAAARERRRQARARR